MGQLSLQLLLQLLHLLLLQMHQLIANSMDKSFPIQEIATNTMSVLRTETEVETFMSKYLNVAVTGYMIQIQDHVHGQKKQPTTFANINLLFFLIKSEI